MDARIDTAYAYLAAMRESLPSARTTLSSTVADVLFAPAVGLLATVFYAALLEIGYEAGVVLSPTADAVVGALVMWGVYVGGTRLWAARSHVLYWGVVAFNTVVVNLYFRSVHVAGNGAAIPKQGPVILIGNHQNQFCDGLLLTAISPRKVSLLTAAKSLDRPIVGAFARGLGVIPVVRPKDAAFVGSGVLSVHPDNTFDVSESFDLAAETVSVTGSGGTRFTDEVGPGTVLSVLDGDVDCPSLRVLSVESDSELVATVMRRRSTSTSTEHAEHEAQEALPPTPLAVDGAAYKVTPKLDHSEMFGAVFDELGSGGTIGLFPEGGSHDNTHLLPLKAGVAFMALGAVEKYEGLAVTIVPVGFNYHSGHRFRAKAVINIGDPIVVDDEWREAFRADSRGTVSRLLATTEDALRSVTINVPDAAFMDFVLTTKRLYTPFGIKLDPAQNLLLTQRFANGLQREEVLSRDDVLALKADVERYASRARAHGYNPLSDEVGARRSLYGLRAVPYALMVLVLALAAAVPGIILNVPVGIVARWLAHRHAAKAVRESSVKVAGRDVISSYKIIVGFVALPLWYITLSVCLMVLTPLRWSAVVLISFAMPVASYLGVRFLESGIVWSRKLYPLLLRILPSYRQEEEALAAERVRLAETIREMVEQLGSYIPDEERVIPKADW